MKKNDLRQALGIILVVLIAAGFAWAGSQDSVETFGLPLFSVGVALAFIFQWIAFIPAFIYKTEKFYDLTGTITYLAVAISALLLGGKISPRAWLVAGLVAVWTVRLGSFLFMRVLQSGKDARFDEIKTSFLRFLMTWTLQGLWVSFTLAAALVILTSQFQAPLDAFAVIGFLVWALGFAIEIAADGQKNAFRKDTANKGKFIRSGLWSWSRHPNYFGEILLWIGVAIIALPVMRGWGWVGLISPVFVYFLITKVSGIPLLEKRADEKWGGQPEYEEYKSGTSILLPLPPKK
jgi:steroid 5-alpha reductase family enzyme